MASAVVVKPSSLESSLLGRRKAALDRYLDHDLGTQLKESDIPEVPHSPSQGPIGSRVMEHVDQESPETTKEGSRVSSSEVKPERSTERRTRAKKGAMRDYSTDSDEEYEGTRGRRRERRGLSDSKYKRNLSDFHFERPDPITAAKNKANRERQRRERLNDSFADLVKTLDPEGSVKGEKTSIIATTIRSINGLRKENEKLKQEKSAIQHQLSRVEEEKRDTEFQRELVERQLEDLRLNVYGPRPIQANIGRAEPAGQMGATQSPSGLSRMLQEQASLEEAARQESLGGLDAEMYQQQARSQQASRNAYMPLMSSQAMDQPMTQQPAHPAGLPSGFHPNTDYLDEILASDITPDGMSMSPIVWLNDALGPEADESYMCSNL